MDASAARPIQTITSRSGAPGGHFGLPATGYVGGLRQGDRPFGGLGHRFQKGIIIMLRIARPTLFLPLPPQVMLLLLTVCACLSAAPRASAQSFACVDIGTAHGDRRPLPAEYYPYSDVATDEASLAANLVGGMQSTVSIRAGDQHLGSGFIWDDQQHVVTNRHVVHDISSPIDVVVTENVYSRDDQSSIVNTVTREWRYRGAEDQVQLVGASAWHDLAVLKIKPSRPSRAAPLASRNHCLEKPTARRPARLRNRHPSV